MGSDRGKRCHHHPRKEKHMENKVIPFVIPFEKADPAELAKHFSELAGEIARRLTAAGFVYTGNKTWEWRGDLKKE